MSQSLLDIREAYSKASRIQEQRTVRARGTKAERLFKLLQIPRGVGLVVYVGLVVVRCPLWLPDEDTDYFTSDFLLLPLPIYLAVDLALALFLTSMKALKFYYIDFTRGMVVRQGVLVGCCALVLVNLGVVFALEQDWFVDVLGKAVFLLVYSRRARRTAMTFKELFKQSLNLYKIYLLNLLMCSSLGYILLKHLGLYPFNSFADSLYEMMVMTTTSNFPDVILPFYDRYRVSCLLFVGYMFVNYMVLTNLLIAFFFGTYKALQVGRINDIKYRLRADLRAERQVHEEDPEPPIFRSFWYELGVTSLSAAQVLFYLAFHQDELHLFEYVILATNLLLLLESLYRLSQVGCLLAVILEAAINVALLVLSVTAIFESGSLSMQIFRAVVLLRMVRVVRVLLREERLQRLAREMLRFGPMLLDLFIVMFIMALVFVFAGSLLFGSLINDESVPELLAKGFKKTDYVYNNFNDIPSSFLVMLELLVVNNWCDNVQMYRILFGSWVRLYFALYYLVNVLLCYNVLIAAIIEHASSSLSN